jgi:hypothetical protein
MPAIDALAPPFDLVFKASSVGVIGSSLNLRMVKVEPCAVTSWPSVIWIREPSCMVASRIGSAMEMYLPARWASLGLPWLMAMATGN